MFGRYSEFLQFHVDSPSRTTRIRMSSNEAHHSCHVRRMSDVRSCTCSSTGIGTRVHELDLAPCVQLCLVSSISFLSIASPGKVSLYNDIPNSITECVKLHHKWQHCACCIESLKPTLAAIKRLMPLLRNRGFSAIGNVNHFVSAPGWTPTNPKL
jgi:hypothetical protein